MNKIDRVLAALAGAPVDRVPASFWFHFPAAERAGHAMAQAHLRYYRAADPDFLKVMNDNGYAPAGTDAIRTPADWRRLRPAPLQSRPFQDQLDGLKEIADAIGGETLLISTVSKILHLSFKRIQFTPDLMPSDITGTEVIYQDPATHERQFKFLKGPIFANIILADEINRTPPKTQAAMLEAMQERKVTVGGVDHKLPDPFFVLATQNPIEQEGTYPLPEAQLDRFMFMIQVDYPSAAEERAIMKMASGAGADRPQAVLTGEDILTLQATVKRMPVADHVYAYAEKLTRVTRIKTPEALDFCRKWLTWGAGPRASINLILGAKARAILNGQFHVSCEDVAAVAPPIFRHRIIPNFAAQSEGVSADDITRKILATIPMDRKLD